VTIYIGADTVAAYTAAQGLVIEQGLPQADVARLLGVTTPAVAKSHARQG